MDDETWINFKKLFDNEYHKLKLNQKLRKVKIKYHCTNSVVPTEDIASAQNILSMATESDQGNVDQLMVKIHQMTETNNILFKKIK